MNAMTSLKVGAKRLAKRLLRPLIYRHLPIGLEPERLQFWLRMLIETSAVDGDVLEIGCSLGGTAAFSSRMLKNLGISKRYVCVDTFGGFVDEQFEGDLKMGNREANRWMFSANSIELVRAVLDQHGAAEVALVPGDIVTLPDSRLPERISAALMDVDLAIPTYEGLKKLYARLADGGTIVVDDCPEQYDWQARQGYSRFCKEAGLPEHYEFRMGVVRKAVVPGSARVPSKER